MDIMSGTSISSIDLRNMNVLETQAVDQYNEMRSELKDMRMDYYRNELLCLIKNPYTGFNDNIFALRPLNGTGYTTIVTIPDNNENANYYKNLVAYEYKKKLCYMAIGIRGNKILLFDKKTGGFFSFKLYEYY